MPNQGGLAAEHILRYFVSQYSNSQNLRGNFEGAIGLQPARWKTNFRQEAPLNPLLPTDWKDISELLTEQVLFVAMIFWG